MENQKNKPFGEVYCFTNKINGKCYIGQAVNFERRKRDHINQSKYNIDNNYFHNAIKKHGYDNFKFEILCECLSKEELDEKEKFYIKELNTKRPNGYNLTDGGEGTIGYKHTDEAKKKISENKKGNKNGMYGKGKHRNRKDKNNPNVKTYKITYPNGEMRIVKCLKQWCKENNFNYSSVHCSFRNNRLYNGYLIEPEKNM